MVTERRFARQVKHTGKAAGDKHAEPTGMYLLVKAAGRYWRMDYRRCGKRKTHESSARAGLSPSPSLADLLSPSNLSA